MTIAELINILHEHLDYYGDREVFYIQENKAYPIAFLGSGSSTFGEYFWFSCDPRFIEGDVGAFKAPAYRPDLKVVK